MLQITLDVTGSSGVIIKEGEGLSRTVEIRQFKSEVLATLITKGS